MNDETIIAIAHPNIALIKYWGDIDVEWHIPANSSLSMNLAELFTQTAVTPSPHLSKDTLLIDGRPASDNAVSRVEYFLNRFRDMYKLSGYFEIVSVNNFPSNAGIASSASAFAALSLAVTRASGLSLGEAELSRLARLGSGSACRSIPGGFVEWQAGNNHESSFAFTIAAPSHWNLVDCIAIVETKEKEISSLQGHEMAQSSPLQQARIIHADERMDECRFAIMSRDFDLLARVTELDSHMMHAVMMTSNPPILYWQPTTLAIMQAVIEWRKTGIPVCYTVDAGANVHVLCEADYSTEVTERLKEIPGIIQVMLAKTGGQATIINSTTLTQF